MAGAEPSMTPDPSKKYWWVVGILVPIIVALIGAQHYCGGNSGNGGNNGTGSTVVVEPSQPIVVKPPCSVALRDEHDDAQKAVHIYDNSIINNQVQLTIEKNAQAMADADNNKIRSDEHRSLAASLETTISELKEYREQAAQRVRDIEQQCAY
jgi:hypothetical protein